MTHQLLLPARLDNGRRWVGCHHCRGLHEQVHHDRDLEPGAPPILPPLCSVDDGLARRLDARVVVLEGVDSDTELLEIADLLALGFAGWRVIDSDGHWTHSALGGRYTTRSAVVAQHGLDAFARLQLRRLGARC